MTAKVIFYWVSNLSPAGFKVSVQLQPASKPQEGWQSVHFGLVWPPKSFCIGFRTCRRRAGSKCLRAAAACHQAPRRVAKRPSGRLRAACQQAPRKVAKRPSNRLRPFVAAKIIFYRVSNLPPSRLQMPPCSCSLPSSPKKDGKARLRPCMAAKVIFYRVSNLPPGRRQMLPCSCSLPPSPKKGGKARLRPCMAAKSN